jgi:hypothetical protein
MNQQKGFATLLAIGAMAIIFLLIFTGLGIVGVSTKLHNKQLRYQGQALDAAEAGLVDSLNFFRRQTIQPVTTFDPQTDDLLATPPIQDSADGPTGIVRNFRVSDLGNICGRYEVRRTEARDISHERGKTSNGDIWEVESRGIIYIDGDNTCDISTYNSSKILVEQDLKTNFQRLSLVLPGGNAALNTGSASTVLIGNGTDKARVQGGTYTGLAHACTGSFPSITCATITGDLAGAPQDSYVSPFNGTINSVFGVTQSELVGSADASFTNAATMPATWTMKLYIVNGDATFTTSKPLAGSGVLVVFGNLTIPAGSTFNGVIYVTGTYTQEGPSLVSGAVVSLGNVTMSGSGDFAEIDYDNSMIQQVQSDLIQYRYGRNPFLVRKIVGLE